MKTQNSNSFTLVEVLIGSFLILLIFLGIFGALQSGLKVLGQSKNKIVATAIANQKIEQIRNLPYESVGVKESFPDGILEKTEKILRNKIEYEIETRVDYVVDSADGISPPEDDCPQDYKKVEVKVSWTGRFSGEVKLTSDISPQNLAQECATLGGILSVSVFDAYGIMVPSPLIEIKNPETDETLKTATPLEGKHYFSLEPETYKVVVSKSGYSSEQTYGSGEIYNGKTIITPEKPHPMVLDGQMTEISFSIDKLSSFSVETLSPWGEDYFADSFSDASKISESSNVSISGDEVNLLKIDEQYQSPGYLISATILPGSLTNWNEFSFADLEPTGTQILYQILYFNGENWILIPNNDLSGNSAGFSMSPVDLSGLNILTYPQLRLRGDFTTADPLVSPTLYNWQVSWITSEPTPIPNTTFNLQGAKVVGKDAGEESIYKYQVNQTSDASGKKNIFDLEWDSYNFSINPATGLDLVEINPSPQPINLPPDSTIPVKLYLDSENSLLITVKNLETLEPVFAASVRLSNSGLGYDTTQYSNEEGQTYFLPLQAATYNLEVQALGYSDSSTSVSVWGDVTKTIKLEQIE